MIGHFGPIEASFAYGPSGNGLVVASPTERSLATFVDLSDELREMLPDWAFPPIIEQGIDELTDGASYIVARLAERMFSNIEVPQFTVAENGIAGKGHEGVDLMLGFGTAELSGQAGNDWIMHFGSGEVQGGDGNDKIFGVGSEYGGPSDRLDLYGGNGNDLIAIVWAEGGYAYGGAGNDIMHGGGKEAHLWGGSGADTFSISSGTHIRDAAIEDSTTFFGIPLYGGAKQWWMEGNTAYWAPFSTVMWGFPVIGSSILTAASFFIDAVTMKFASYQVDANGDLQIQIGWGLGGRGVVNDYRLDFDSGVGTGGITVFQADRGGSEDASLGRVQQFVNLALYAGFGGGLPGFDPLVLDLDGDGLELTTENNSRAYFEFDSDGFAERTGWVRPDDGLLAIDLNGNGTIDNVGELFGNRTTSGFAILSGYDLNADGVIDASDAVYANLRIWQDVDQDGVSDAGELKTLAELGIVSISLSHAAPGEPTEVGGNTIVHTGSFTRADGTTGAAADVASMINETATRWRGDSTVSASAAALPQLRGFGEVRDLRVAMTGDPALETMVAAFAAETSNDLAVLKAQAETILYKWAGVDGVAADAIGVDGFDARKLAFLEVYTGHLLMPRDTNGTVVADNLDEMEALWADQLTRLTLRLVVQGPLADVFDGIDYRTDLDLLVAETPTSMAASSPTCRLIPPPRWLSGKAGRLCSARWRTACAGRTPTWSAPTISRSSSCTRTASRSRSTSPPSPVRSASTICASAAQPAR